MVRSRQDGRRRVSQTRNQRNTTIYRCTDRDGLDANRFVERACHMTSSNLEPENSAQDLESFAKHAGRRTVTTDDVLLLTRRNDGLKDLMEAYVQKQKAQKTKKSARRGG